MTKLGKWVFVGIDMALILYALPVHAQQTFDLTYQQGGAGVTTYLAFDDTDPLGIGVGNEFD
ncbi:hypothetical protein ACFL6U_25350 [Planctomycetota bacterium]